MVSGFRGINVPQLSYPSFAPPPEDQTLQITGNAIAQGLQTGFQRRDALTAIADQRAHEAGKLTEQRGFDAQKLAEQRTYDERLKKDEQTGFANLVASPRQITTPPPTATYSMERPEGGFQQETSIGNQVGFDVVDPRYEALTQVPTKLSEQWLIKENQLRQQAIDKQATVDAFNKRTVSTSDLGQDKLKMAWDIANLRADTAMKSLSLRLQQAGQKIDNDIMKQAEAYGRAQINARSLNGEEVSDDEAEAMVNDHYDFLIRKKAGQTIVEPAIARQGAVEPGFIGSLTGEKGTPEVKRKKAVFGDKGNKVETSKPATRTSIDIAAQYMGKSK